MFSPEKPQSKKVKSKAVKPAKPPENRGLTGVLGWGFILLGVASLIFLILSNTKEKNLVCQNSLGSIGSLTSFGDCSSE